MGIESGTSHHSDRIPQSDIEVRVEKKVEITPKFPQIRIVRLKMNDWEVLRELKLRSLRQEPIAFEDQDEGMARYLARNEGEWRKKLDPKDSNKITYVAKCGDKYVGMISAVVLDLPSGGIRKATIQHFYVDSDGYTGQGIGTKLLTRLVENLKGRGDLNKIDLVVAEPQVAARRVYKNLGFKAANWVMGGAIRDGRRYNEFEFEMSLKTGKNQK